MKNYLRSAALLLTGLATASLAIADPGAAECLDGKSEIIVMTQKGITKTFCVSDNAIPGIENAAEHSDRVMIEPECPCLDVWDGAPYPDGTQYDEVGSIIPLPTHIPEESLCLGNSGTNEISLSVLLYDTDIQASVAEYIAIAGSAQDMCYMDMNYGSSVRLETPGQQLFTDGFVSPTTGQYTSSMMDACKALLKDRGCMF